MYFFYEIKRLDNIPKKVLTISDVATILLQTNNLSQIIHPQSVVVRFKKKDVKHIENDIEFLYTQV